MSYTWKEPFFRFYDYKKKNALKNMNYQMDANLYGSQNLSKFEKSMYQFDSFLLIFLTKTIVI